VSLGLLSYSQLLEGTGMGHYCRICGRERPNEQFSGKGHKIHVCKRCKARPESERQAIEDKDDIFAFFEQSRISEKNVAHLERMAKSNNSQVASLAAIVLDVARVKPYKTRRLKFLAQKHPELLGKLRDTGLVLVHHW
jgi:ribosome-binding protein aMBF1 (putative translation factor)